MSGMVSLSVLLAACGLLEVLRAILENVVFYGPSAKELAFYVANNTGNDTTTRYGYILKDKAAEGPLQAAPLGISNGYISSGQITASSNHDADHDTRGVRLLRSVHPIGSWSARHNDNQQWVQIDLLQITTVTGVATQGRNGVDQWVTTYKIEYSTNGVTWSVYKEDGKDKVFIGNTDQNGVVKNDFAAPFKGQYIKLRPLTWFSHISLRLELYGQQDVCNSGLGMVSGALDASSVAASSSINEDHDERGSRLLTNTNGAHSLSVKHKDTYQYLQIDVGIVTNITAVATQGRNAIAQWVKDYLLLYSTDGSTWFTYKENDAVKLFAGNTDSKSVVSHKLPFPVAARYVRFQAQTWQEHISFRAEVYGCPSECDLPLGMTTGEIDAYHVSTSSNHNPAYDQRGARLLTDTPIGAWAARYNDVYQWIQVSFRGFRRVTGVSTQGRIYLDQWVTSYYVSYCSDGRSWTLYHELDKHSPKLFIGNADRDGVVKNTFHPSFIAKFARILPQSFHGHISLRFEFYGCTVH